MSASQINNPSKGTPRRALGDLTPRALNTPSRRADPFDGTRAQSPLKQMQTLSPQLFGGKENAIANIPKGTKRNICEVDDVERVEDAKIRAAESNAVKIGLSAATVRLHTDYTTVDLPVPGSPTERNTPTPEPEPVSQDTQGSQNSFSALINYDLCASQNSVQAPPSCAPSLPAPVEEKKSRAELLRTRLGFGIYKVKTNQVQKRSTEIISTWESSFSEATDASTSMAVTSSGESKDAHHVPNINVSPVRRDPQPVFIKANLDPLRPIGNLKLTPAPRLNYATPVNQSPRSERGDSDSREGSAQSGLRKMQRFQEGELTSSAVKGNAAKGLMQLMAGKR
ncbi:hypothetical protein BU23DRAFT_471498 [Bimuria novae-zelandiae CBS 107.79]|uniref:Uncharacterized protein n=1 Tax=Bimuria novae-zelandiae CBS 107.79 TaxID=1447943 RepID=A0A6A5V383_9PLEO|nr:hypothetical protein BU23DRAFT_471498 [Bimuria novae-zelandiae CBS 107.79]